VTDKDPSLASLFRMDGRVALITGGYGDIAAAAAHAFAEQGCDVVLAARRSARSEDLAEEIRSVYGRSVVVASVDVSDEAGVHELVARTVSQFGRLDVVLNSAAIYWGATPEETPIDRGWRRILDVNVTGTFLVCQAAGRVMLEAGSGSIINMASSGAFMSFLPEVGSTPSYTLSKGAIVNMTRDLAAAWSGRGVRVNAVAPGSMNAGMMDSVVDDKRARMMQQIPMRRFGFAHELKGAMAYLASDASSYVTGTVLLVDGGQTIV
jgi:gluconate 5-dehydrogenase